MRVILSKQCLSLTGMLRTDLGYYLRSTKKGNFYAQRSKHSVPPDGHLRFIFLCAELAQSKLHITDIKVDWLELHAALTEARFYAAALHVDPNNEYNAAEVLQFKKERGL